MANKSSEKEGMNWKPLAFGLAVVLVLAILATWLFSSSSSTSTKKKPMTVDDIHLDGSIVPDAAENAIGAALAGPVYTAFDTAEKAWDKLKEAWE